MKGSVINLTKVFDGASNELVIPVYQRNYDWQERHCERLVEDLEEISAKGYPNHFFGAVVCQPVDSFCSVIIDGQQRITTSSLLMLALVHGAEAGEISLDPTTARKIRKSFLMKDDDESDEPGAKIKLKPVKNDQAAYNRLFGEGLELIESSSITANYRFFRQRLQQSPVTGDDLWCAFGKLEVMFLDLEASDDPQRIFESLNSTGLALAEADKIRNAILMGLDPKTQQRLYENYWNVIEENVGYNTDQFIRHYLTTKLEQAPRNDRIYESFQKYRKSSGRDAQDVLAELLEYSISLRDYLNANTGVPAADKRLQRFLLLGIDVVQPFMLPVLKEVRQGTIGQDDFARVVEVLDTYFARRIFCRVPTMGLNKLFATLYRELTRKREDGVDFSDVLVHTLLNRTRSSYFPRDEDVAEALATVPLFNIPKKYRMYTFHCLENIDSRDVTDVVSGIESGELSIEHIMPQTLTKQWKEELGPDWERIHTTWLHRLANLTITGYNSSYSNRSFAEKKTMAGGFDVTPYRLNDDIKRVDTWSEEALEQRTKTLTQRALGYWPMPSTDFSPIAPVVSSFQLSDDFDPTNLRARSYDTGEGEVLVKSWREVLTGVLAYAAREQREKFMLFARENKNLLIPEDGDPRSDAESALVAPGVYLRWWMSSRSTLEMLSAVYERVGLDPETLTITYHGEAVKQDAPEPVDPFRAAVLHANQTSEACPEASSVEIIEIVQPMLDNLPQKLQAKELTPHELSDLQGVRDLGEVPDAVIASAVVQVVKQWQALAPAMHEYIAPVPAVSRWIRELGTRFA